jgi:type IV secretory pathway VirB3-like protein
MHTVLQQLTGFLYVLQQNQKYLFICITLMKMIHRTMKQEEYNIFFTNIEHAS